MPALGLSWCHQSSTHGLLARYVKLLVAHAPGMPGTFSPPPWVSDPDMHHGTCVTWCMPWSLTSGFLWSRWREKRSRHSRCMRNQWFYVSGKRPITWTNVDQDLWYLKCHKWASKNILILLMVGWLLCFQPIISLVWHFLLPNMGFNMVFISNEGLLWMHL